MINDFKVENVCKIDLFEKSVRMKANKIDNYQLLLLYDEKIDSMRQTY